MTDTSKTTDHDKLLAVAQSSRDLFALQATQKTTMAIMIRACIRQLKSPDATKRAQAIKALDDLADMLDKGAEG
jgi:hypothetical protein